ncbi:leucyl-tRNA--protein transferase [Leadbettera azotonutricia]|uniref:Leucyl/phenylalanyl-tRNA protein transferase n=1 Tax=Leadbettera azotonutricia (strain ATCC BAA-888 / DSM 13862 / ZAS-9) TaxID=545695 RepID=F5Y9B6_LEAAZ|nr:leucyl-tRNA--protein transferase [Leadbettera azotonutricia]AEF82466.1 leucyl/phenylalanyl-tRNA protein transferase [Leadbettera azotonutricia ZAS-9]
MPYPLRYTQAGYVFLDPDDDCQAAARALRDTGYNEEFCLARDFDVPFIADLMASGFLVMSEYIVSDTPGEPGFLILLPKHHLIRSCLFFPELHIKKSIRPLLSRYELRFDTNFDLIIDKCLATHGDGWLTAPLVQVIRDMRKDASLPARPVSFGLYRDGKLRAGEFGIIAGKVYTSYSGYYEEDNTGTVQMVLTSKYLENHGFAFWDLGMPLDYKLTLGAREIGRDEFMERFWPV